MLEKIEKFVASVCVVIMAVLVFANVIARKVFDNSLAFSDEMSTYLFVLMSFMGTAIAARRNAHLVLSSAPPVPAGPGDRRHAVAGVDLRLLCSRWRGVFHDCLYRGHDQYV